MSRLIQDIGRVLGPEHSKRDRILESNFGHKLFGVFDAVGLDTPFQTFQSSASVPDSQAAPEKPIEQVNTDEQEIQPGRLDYLLGRLEKPGLEYAIFAAGILLVGGLFSRNKTR